MSNVYSDFIYWEFLGFVNLTISILVYRATQLERKQKRALEYDLSTKSVQRHLSLPSYFTYLSFFTGMLNFGGGYLRFRRIHFLDIPTIPWMYQAMSGGKLSDELMHLLEAEWVVAMNDWSSLFLALTFFVAGAFNFATVRQLLLRDRRDADALLPKPSPMTEKFSKEGLREKAVVGGHSRGKSFSVFSNSQQLCAKRV